MGFFKRFRQSWELTSMLDSFDGADNVMRYLDFFAFSGNNCSPAFCIKLNTFGGIEEAYYKCAPLSTVIDRNAQAMANAKWWITDDEDDNKIELFPYIKDILKKPNPIQSWSEFIIQLDVCRQLYGEVFVYASIPEGLSINELTSLWVIKPAYIKINQTKKLYNQSDINGIIKSYSLIINNETTELPKENVLHIKDTFQNLNLNPTNIRGASRLIGLEFPLKNIIQAYEAIYSLNKDRGAMGILSNDTKDKIGNIPLTPNEKEEIQKIYQNNYGIHRNQWKAIITNASLKWQQMSFNVKDLMLFDGIRENITQIADAYGYPYELLGHVTGVTYANKLEAKKWYYQDTIIPIANLYGEKFTSFFNLGEYKMYADFSDVEVMKEAELTKADALHRNAQALKILFESNLISREEARTKLDMDQKIDGNTMYNGNEESENTGPQGNQTDQEEQGFDSEE